jgi:glycosyltransferase involved in cell wall biosynthesis
VQPTVSVVLPLYNCTAYVGEAIESILAQTYADFELIVIDDGSTDETPRIAQGYRDPRLRFLAQENRGLAATLNRGIGLARGRYVARQDQDDVSRPERFQRQVAFLDAHARCALVGTWADIWAGGAATGRTHRHPEGNAELQYELLLDNPFVHSSVMLRRDALDAVGGYSTDPARQPPEDFELWSRIARRYEVANIPQVLHVYREVAGSMSRAGDSPFVNHLVTICAENIASASATVPTNPNVVNIAALAHSAVRRVEGEPDFDAMTEVFKRAATHVGGEGGEAFATRAEARIKALRARHRELKYGRGWRRHLFRAARGASQLMRRS